MEAPETVPIPPAPERPALFRLGVTPVTNAQYAVFLGATPDVPAPPWFSHPDFSAPRQPVVVLLQRGMVNLRLRDVGHAAFSILALTPATT